MTVDEKNDSNIYELNKNREMITINSMLTEKVESTIDVPIFHEIDLDDEVGIDEADERLKSILDPGDPSLDIKELREIFSNLNIDARQLRKQAWERKDNLR